MTGTSEHSGLIFRSKVKHSDIWAQRCSLAWARVEGLALKDWIGKSLSPCLVWAKFHWRLETYTNACSSLDILRLREIRRNWVALLMILLTDLVTILLLLNWRHVHVWRFHFADKFVVFYFVNIYLIGPNEHLFCKVRDSLVMLIGQTVGFH